MSSPTPDLKLTVPVELLREFRIDPRIVVRHPWIIGIPAPELIARPEVLKQLSAAGYDVMLVPKQQLQG